MFSIAMLLMPTSFAANDILILGNSYVSQQALQTVIAQVFEAAGTAQNSTALTAGGLTLVDHAERTATIGSLWNDTLVQTEESLSWVVLQDQSQIPSLARSDGLWLASVGAALSLNSKIEAKSGETMFFLTWGRRDGDVTNIERNPDYPTMQDNLTSGYLGYIDEISTEERPTWIAPVGVGFQHIYNDIIASGEDPQETSSLFYSLYTNDGSHPSFLGSYLAACVFYTSITGRSPIGLTPPRELTDEGDLEVVTTLQTAAHAAVFEHLEEFEFIWEGTIDTGDTSTGDSDTSTGDSDTNSSIEFGDGTDGTDIPTNESCGCNSTESNKANWLWAMLIGSTILARRSLKNLV